MGRLTAFDFRRLKGDGKRIAVLTGYDALFGRLLEAAQVHAILVGDSVGNVLLGYRDPLPVSMADIRHHAAAVRRGAPETFVIGDMPFMSYQGATDDALRNAACLVKEAGCDAVKLEGGESIESTIRAIVQAGIPVMGHLGLTPQNASQLGGYRVQANTAESALRLIDEAQRVEAAGAFAVVLECVPRRVAQAVSERLTIPTIGIGAGEGCDGQVLVSYDMLGFGAGASFKFVRTYANLESLVVEAFQNYVRDVVSGDFPTASEGFGMPEEELAAFEERLRG